MRFLMKGRVYVWFVLVMVLVIIIVFAMVRIAKLEGDIVLKDAKIQTLNQDKSYVESLIGKNEELLSKMNNTLGNLSNSVKNMSYSLFNMESALAECRSSTCQSVKMPSLECEGADEELMNELRDADWLVNSHGCIMCAACSAGCSCTEENYLVYNEFSISATYVSCDYTMFKLKAEYYPEYNCNPSTIPELISGD